MQLIDLTHPLTEDMPLYPGTPAPRVFALHRYENDGFREKQVTFTTHTGTHVDAPAHMLEQGATLDQLKLRQFYGSAIALDVRAFSGKRIPAEFLQERRALWQTVDFLLFYTGYDRFWGSEAYFENYPVLSSPAATLLAEQAKLQGIGFDTISPDEMNSQTYPVHQQILNAGWIIIENLTNLGAVVNQSFILSVFPLMVKGADGFPVRAVAILS